MNGDGNVDLLVADESDSKCAGNDHATLALYSGNGDGTFNKVYAVE